MCVCVCVCVRVLAQKHRIKVQNVSRDCALARLFDKQQLRVLTVHMIVRMVFSAPDLPVWQNVVWGPPNQSDVMDRDELSDIHFEWARTLRKVVGDKASAPYDCEHARCTCAKQFASLAFACLSVHVPGERGGRG